MSIHLTSRSYKAMAAAPRPVQKAFIEQINALVREIPHPGLHAKKHKEAKGKWQACRVNDEWRFYFKVVGDTYRILDLVQRPK